MRILVLGGSGFLGVNLIRYLLRKGYKDIISFDIEAFNHLEKSQIEHVIGDIRNREALVAVLPRVEVIVNCAAALPHYPTADIFSTNVDGAELVLTEALRKAVRRVIHISSTAVYDIDCKCPITEGSKLGGVGPYGKAKIKAEEMVEKFRKIGLCVPVLRPKTFVGPERLGVFGIFYEWASEGRSFPLLGSGNNKYQLLDVEDLCEAIFLCMTEHALKVNDTFNVGAKKFSSIKEDYQAVLDRAGFAKKIKLIPSQPAAILLTFLDFFHLSPLYKWIYKTVDKDSFVSTEKIETALDFKPNYSNKQALVRNYEWFLKNRVIVKNKYGISHGVSWRQGLLRFLKVFF